MPLEVYAASGMYEQQAREKSEVSIMCVCFVAQCVITGAFTIIAAVTSARLTCKFANQSRLKTATCVAKAIMKAMSAEISVGISVLKAYINGEYEKRVRDEKIVMPTKCWESYTLSTDLLEAILRKTEGKRSKLAFQPEDFLVHLKNYYSYICGNVNAAIGKNLEASKEHGELLQSAKNVLTMVDEIVAFL